MQAKKNKKLCLRNNPSPSKGGTTLYSIKQQYLLHKLENLKNDEKRKQERHEKEMELLNIQIENQRKQLNIIEEITVV